MSELEIINKSTSKKDKFFREQLRTLNDVVRNLGIVPDLEFIISLDFPQAKEGDNLQLLQGVINSEEGRVVNCINYFEDIILKNISKVSDDDLMKLLVFYKNYEKQDSYLTNIINKSCENCNVDDVEEFKVFRNKLGQFTKEE